MPNEYNGYADLSVWQAATLYLGLMDENEPTGELFAQVKKNSEHSPCKEDKNSWKLLHEAINKFDVRKIKQIGVDSRDNDLPWPEKFRRQGENYHRALRMFFS